MSVNKTYRVVRRYMNSTKQPKVMGSGLSEHAAQGMCSMPVPESIPVSTTPPPTMMQADTGNHPPAYVDATDLGQPSVPSEIYLDSYEVEN